MGDNNERSSYLYDIGMECVENGEFEKALAYFQQSLILDKHSRTYARIYECLIELGNKREARPYIEIAYNMNKNHDKVAIQYATELIDEGKSSEASIILESILARNTTYLPAKRLLDKIKGF